MAAPRLTACAPWTDIESVTDCGSCSDVTDSTLIERMIGVATDVLFRLSGRKYAGACEGVARPCRRLAWPDAPPYSTRSTGMLAVHDYAWGSTGWVGSWGTCGCDLSSACGCPTTREISLGVFPLVSIDAVYIDGAALASSAYRIDDYRTLVRTDGEGWPMGQDLLADYITDENTFGVEFTYGATPPPSGKHAASVLACNLIRACVGKNCNLPQRVQSIARQGVTVIVDPREFLEEGKTGLYEVDLFLAAHNPGGKQTRSTVASPDYNRPVRHVDTGS